MTPGRFCGFSTSTTPRGFVTLLLCLAEGSREPYLGHTLVRYGTPEHVHSALWLRMGELPGPAGSSFMLMLRLPLWELPPKPAAHWNGKGGARPFE